MFKQIVYYYMTPLLLPVFFFAFFYYLKNLLYLEFSGDLLNSSAEPAGLPPLFLNPRGTFPDKGLMYLNISVNFLREISFGLGCTFTAL